MGAYQAYDGGKGHTMVGSGTGILWQYFMNTLFLAPHRRRSHNRRRHDTHSAQRAPPSRLRGHPCGDWMADRARGAL